MDPTQSTFRSQTTPFRHVRWRYVSAEAVLIVTAYFVYFLVRGTTEGARDDAYRNAERVMSLQDSLSLAWETTMQGWILGSHAMVTLANWVYIWGHWPVIGVAALWLVLTRPADYRLIRNAFLISGGIGLIIFATFPVAPPRFMDIDIVDTVTRHSNAYRVFQPPALVNEYAAVPSLHFGWNLLIGITLAWKAKLAAIRAFGVAMPPTMFLAIVLTGNHYVFDAIVGGAVAITGLVAALYLRRLHEERRKANGDPGIDPLRVR
jgi:hypothetical protein